MVTHNHILRHMSDNLNVQFIIVHISLLKIYMLFYASKFIHIGYLNGQGQPDDIGTIINKEIRSESELENCIAYFPNNCRQHHNSRSMQAFWLPDPCTNIQVPDPNKIMHAIART